MGTSCTRATEVIRVRPDVNTVTFDKRTPLHLLATSQPRVFLVAIPYSGLQPEADTAIRPPDAAQRDIVQIESPSQEELGLVLSFCFVEDRQSDYQLDGLISWAHPQGKLNKQFFWQNREGPGRPSERSYAHCSMNRYVRAAASAAATPAW